MWELKKQKCFDACPDQGLVGTQARVELMDLSGGADSQTTATKRAVAGTFQRSDARRYILIHGRLAQDSQEVKTNKSNTTHNKQTTHQRRVDLGSRL